MVLLSTLALGSVKGQDISEKFPFESKYQDVLESKVHYIEEYGDDSNPDQLTFLFLHGNPSSSYIWRNIIPHIKGQGRAIAVDLIGMGKSGKPAIDYTFQDHSKYLEEFIAQKNLKNIVLVLHDWGSGLGFHYASRHEENVVGIAFMEAVTQPMSWKDMNFLQKMMFKRFRDDEKGHKMIGENNFFIKKFLFKLGINRKLTQAEKDYYSAPYPTVESRKPIEQWPKEIPIDGDPDKNYFIVNNYANWLDTTSVPKLLLYAKPGMILKKKDVERIKNNYKNLEAVFIGKGKHYIQEDQPYEIGNAISNWAIKLE